MLRKVLVLSLSLFFCTSFIHNPLKAQTLETDSLALLCIYLDTGGETFWLTNTNWDTAEPLSTWFGVTVDPANNRVSELKLPSNNVTGDIPDDINNLTALQELDVSDNKITHIPDLTNLFSLFRLIVNKNRLETLPITATSTLLDLKCEDNRLTFIDIEPKVGLVINEFTYAPQARFAEERFQYAFEFDGVGLINPLFSGNNLYFWKKDGVPVSGVPDPNPLFSISTVMEADEGDYHVEVTNPLLPDLTMISRDIHLRLYDRDSLGGEFVPNHLIIEFTDDATQFEKDTLLDFYQAERLDVCMCGIIELWLMPDTSFLPDGELIIGLEMQKEDAMTKSKVEDNGYNYAVLTEDWSNEYTQAKEASMIPYSPPVPPPGGPVPVGLVDVGVDNTVSQLFLNLWINGNEQEDNSDNDGNCLVDDINGFNFFDRNNQPYDQVNGHGTHIAGIILDLPASVGGEMSIISAKSHNDDGLGFLFDAMCGIYYVADQDARVINLSWGYAGEESTVFRSAIARAGSDCGALFVTSAGNENEDNDQLPHYPSGFDLDNVISVAALNETFDGKYSASNFGIESVDIAAPGENVISIVPGGALEARSGTSMAAGAVSRIAGLLFFEFPDLTWLNIREAILSTAIPVPELNGQIATGGQVDLNAARNFLMGAVPNLDCEGPLSTESVYSVHALKVRAFPQPFNEEVILELELESINDLTISFFDMTGQLLHQEQATFPPGIVQYSWMPDRTLPPGMYMAKIQSKEGIGLVKLLRQ